MNKLWLIIQREYLVRVKKKSFLLITLLTPIGLGLLVALSAYITNTSNNFSKKVLVKDDSGIFENAEKKATSMDYEFSRKSVDELKSSYEEEYDILLHIPNFENFDKENFQLKYFSKDKLGLATIGNIEKYVGKAFTNHKITISEIDRAVYDSFKTKVDLENGAIEDGDSSDDKTGKLTVLLGTMLGGFMGFMMYMVIFIYGNMVMKSVMEEKINRIVEVMISSVKPIQLMLGKILGVGAVGLTQLAIWMILIPVILYGLQIVLGGSQDAQQMQELAQQMNDLPMDVNELNINNAISEFKQMNWFLILPVFVIFFFGGYFIYSSLFAAIGSAISEDMGEGQQLMLPVMIPVIVAFLLLQPVLQDPNGTLAVVASMVPFFSPILMPARLAFDPPIWQILLSILILIGTSIFIAWIAGRIYRVGILMYGKKVNFKEVTKWLFYRS